MSEVTVTPLASTDIDRSSVSTSAPAAPAAPAPAEFQPASAPTAPIETHAAAQSQIADLRRQGADPQTTPEQRAAIVSKLSALEKFVHGIGKAPPWLAVAQPLSPEQLAAPHDSLGDEIVKQMALEMTQLDRDQMTAHGRANGIEPEMANAAVDFATAAGLGKVETKVLIDRMARHVQHGDPFGGGGFRSGPLSDGDRTILSEALVQRCGSDLLARELDSLASQYIESRGLTDWVRQHAGTIAADPNVLNLLANRARQLGFKAK